MFNPFKIFLPYWDIASLSLTPMSLQHSSWNMAARHTFDYDNMAQRAKKWISSTIIIFIYRLIHSSVMSRWCQKLEPSANFWVNLERHIMYCVLLSMILCFLDIITLTFEWVVIFFEWPKYMNSFETPQYFKTLSMALHQENLSKCVVYGSTSLPQTHILI